MQLQFEKARGCGATKRARELVTKFGHKRRSERRRSGRVVAERCYMKPRTFTSSLPGLTSEQCSGRRGPPNEGNRASSHNQRSAARRPGTVSVEFILRKRGWAGRAAASFRPHRLERLRPTRRMG